MSLFLLRLRNAKYAEYLNVENNFIRVFEVQANVWNEQYAKESSKYISD